MVSRSDDTINFDKLETELNAAVDADERYQRENDAKFRAVNQRVATYEEFRDIVLASHIKPLEKDDLLKAEDFKQQWNVQAPTFKKDGGSSKEDGKEIFVKKAIAENIPKNGHEFTKEWRRNCKTLDEKYRCLLDLGADKLGAIFKAEVSFGLLGEFFQVLKEGFKATESLEILHILEQLSTTNRFQLNLQFLSASEKNTCKELVQKIAVLSEENERENDSCKEYDSLQKRLDVVIKQYGVELS